MVRISALLTLVLLAPPDGIREIKDLPYVDGADADPVKHKLDLYLPQEGAKVPVVMWIHGGAWKLGDRSWYGEVGRRFAESGVGFAAISYRLSPKVKHPAHVEDCARAFAWLHASVAKHGGDPDRLFVAGQSAGGHLAALLALDDTYLKALKVPDGAIKGTIPMSGVYTIPALPAGTTGLMSMFPEAFGSDPEICKAASPAHHVARLSMPMLVITETQDLGAIKGYAQVFRIAAERAGVKTLTFMDAEQRNHFTIVTSLARKSEDPQRTAMVEFVKKRCKDLDRAK